MGESWDFPEILSNRRETQTSCIELVNVEKYSDSQDEVITMVWFFELHETASHVSVTDTITLNL